MPLQVPGARKTPKRETVDNRFQERNRLALAIVVAAGGGFLVAMYLGAFATTKLEEVPPWLSAVMSVFATAISALAVFLVAKTLQATRETLDATREMAADQKRIGEAQTRPYLHMVKQYRRTTDTTLHQTIVLENFGNTPATAIEVQFVLESLRVQDRPDGEGNVPEIFDFGMTFQKTKEVIPPKSPEEFEVYLDRKNVQSADFSQFLIKWEYYSHDMEIRYTGSGKVSL